MRVFPKLLETHNCLECLCSINISLHGNYEVQTCSSITMEVHNEYMMNANFIPGLLASSLDISALPIVLLLLNGKIPTTN